MVSERRFWKTLAWILGVALAGMVLVNALGLFSVPWQVTSFTASCLFCIGVGHTIVSPRSSLLLLDGKAERSIRRRQLVAGMVISVLLALLLLLPEVRHKSVHWVLLPVIALAPVLVVREYLAHLRKQKR